MRIERFGSVPEHLFSVEIIKRETNFIVWKTLCWMLLTPLCLRSFCLPPKLETVFFLQDSYVAISGIARTNILLCNICMFFSYSNFGWNWGTPSISSCSWILHLQSYLNFLHQVVWDLCKKSTVQDPVVTIAEIQVQLLSGAVSYN